jgi:hypothetical protein
MKPWARTLLIIVAVVVVLYGAFTAFALVSNGTDDNVVIHVGKDKDGMYMRCSPGEKSGNAKCDDSRQTTVTVAKRDRVTITVIDDDGGNHGHDFNIEGWEYFLWPNSPETELEKATETVTFTTWATGTFHMLCELEGHDKAGMNGTLIVK